MSAHTISAVPPAPQAAASTAAGASQATRAISVQLPQAVADRLAWAKALYAKAGITIKSMVIKAKMAANSVVSTVAPALGALAVGAMTTDTGYRTGVKVAFKIATFTAKAVKFAAKLAHKIIHKVGGFFAKVVGFFSKKAGKKIGRWNQKFTDFRANIGTSIKERATASMTLAKAAMTSDPAVRAGRLGAAALGAGMVANKFGAGMVAAKLASIPALGGFAAAATLGGLPAIAGLGVIALGAGLFAGLFHKPKVVDRRFEMAGEGYRKTGTRDEMPEPVKLPGHLAKRGAAPSADTTPSQVAPATEEMDATISSASTGVTIEVPSTVEVDEAEAQKMANEAAVLHLWSLEQGKALSMMDNVDEILTAARRMADGQDAGGFGWEPNGETINGVRTFSRTQLKKAIRMMRAESRI